MQRRQFLVSSLAFLPCVAIAKDLALNKDSVPLKHIYVPADSNKVLFFFDFSCNFSATYHPAMFNWARSAPPAVKFEFVPVINLADSRRINEMSVAAAAYLSAQVLSKNSEQLETFVVEVYNNRQIKGIPLKDTRLWSESAKKAKLNVDQLFTTAKNTPKSQLIGIANRCKKYELTVTPTAAVAGQYLLTPDNANGDPELFFNLLNGLVSNFLLT